jgi:hypothetical protein
MCTKQFNLRCNKSINRSKINSQPFSLFVRSMSNTLIVQKAKMSYYIIDFAQNVKTLAYIGTVEQVGRLQ